VILLGIGVMPALAKSPLRVWSGDMHDWYFIDDSNGQPCFTPDCGIEFSTQPLAGDGSVRLAVDNIFEPFKKSMLFAPVGKGKELKKIKALAYSAFVWANSSSPLAPALAINIDLDVKDKDNAWQGRLVFDPRNQDQSTLAGEWQVWNAMADEALWYLADAPLNAINYCVETSPCTLQQIVDLYPHAGIHKIFGGVGFYVGGWGLEQIQTSVDSITLGIKGHPVTYDFETGGPTNHKECKYNGWVGYFENQGQCDAQFKATSRKRPAADEEDETIAPTSYKECKYNGWVGYFASESQCVAHFKANR
jgi:hypothetical protein